MYLSVTVMLLSRLRKRRLLSWKLHHRPQVIIMLMSPIIGIHTGPGVQAVIYFEITDNESFFFRHAPG